MPVGKKTYGQTGKETPAEGQTALEDPTRARSGRRAPVRGAQEQQHEATEEKPGGRWSQSKAELTAAFTRGLTGQSEPAENPLVS